jgi:glycosyltransferase 2 family protein
MSSKTTTNAFLAFDLTPLIVDGCLRCASMRKPLRTAVILVLSVGLLALFLRGANLGVVWTEMRNADSWLMAFSAVVTVATMVLRALRWQYLLAPIGYARFSPAFRTTIIGFAASAVLPARAGEVIRPYLLARQESLSATATFATIIIERLLDAVTCVILLASFVLLFDPGMDRANPTLYSLLQVGGATVGGLALLVLGVMFFAARDPQAVGAWAYKVEHLLPGRITHALAVILLRFAEGLGVVRTPKRLFSALLLSFPTWLTIGLGIWLVIKAFGIDLPFTGSFLLIALLIVGVSVPTPGAVGGFEAAVQIGLTSFYGVPNDRAVGAALVLHIVTLLPVVALGFLFLIQDGLGLAGMRNLAHAAAEGDAR